MARDLPLEDPLVRMQRDLKRALKNKPADIQWGMVIDITKCIGCHACTIRCVAENKLPPGVVYRVVLEEDVGSYPHVRHRFTPRPCLHCQNPPCTKACPVTATCKTVAGGVAALLRRRHLLEIGGLVEDTITEDAGTALRLHARGFNSVYLNKAMVMGLSPESFDSFIIQRSRWAKGMLQILLLRNPLRQKGLALPQRICYLNACLFWLFGFARIIFFLSPLMFLLFGLRVYNASLMQVLVYAVPHLLGSYFLSNYLYGKLRHPFYSELFLSMQNAHGETLAGFGNVEGEYPHMQ